ncbi:MAG: hypothetical protein V7784_13760 [Oceanospirillaceae bacterium]
MLIFISLLGGVVIYEVFDNLSGLDAIGIAGMVTGFAIGLFSGKNLGMFSIFPSFIASISASAFFAILVFFSMNPQDPLTLVLGQFAIGFWLLAGDVVGCQWGKHFLIREEDLAHLRAAFGERSRNMSFGQKEKHNEDE